MAPARQGDQAAFGQLMQRHYAAVFRRVVTIVRNEEDAKDLCQEIWMQVWEKLPGFRGDALFTTWLFPLATRRALDHLRKRRRWFDRFLPFSRPATDSDREITFEPAEPAPGPPARTESQERLAQIEAALGRLSPPLRAVFTLREIEGLSYEEIATTLQWPLGTVMSRLHHARRLLARELKDLPCD